MTLLQELAIFGLALNVGLFWTYLACRRVHLKDKAYQRHIDIVKKVRKTAERHRGLEGIIYVSPEDFWHIQEFVDQENNTVFGCRLIVPGEGYTRTR